MLKSSVRGNTQIAAPVLNSRPRPNAALDFRRPQRHAAHAALRRGVRACLCRGAMAEAFNEPLGVVAVEEVRDDPPRLRQALEPMQIDALLPERAHEALDDAVALGLADVGRRDRDPEPLHLVDPGIGDILRAPVAPDLQPARDVLAEPVEGVTSTLPNRLEGGPAIPELGDVPAEQLVGVMVDGPEEPAPAVFLGVEPRGVGAPHLVRACRDDRAGVGRIRHWAARAAAVPGADAARITRRTRLPPTARPRWASRARTFR